MTAPIDQAQDFRKYEEQGAYHWSTLKPALKTTFNPYLHARYSVALEQIPQASANAVAVDFGCGDGYITNQLAAMNYKAFGIDGSAIAIEYAHKMTPSSKKEKIKLSVGNVCDTKLPADSADLIVSLDVIEHLADPEAMLREMVRVGKNGATVLIGTPLRFTEKPTDTYHVQEFFETDFAALLGKFFNVKTIKKSHPIEWLALMRRKFSILGKQKHLGWNFINLYFLLKGKNLLASQNSEFPTYQFAVCQLKK